MKRIGLMLLMCVSCCIAMGCSVDAAVGGSMMTHDCMDIEYIFARGSGQEINQSAE